MRQIHYFLILLLIMLGCSKSDSYDALNVPDNEGGEEIATASIYCLDGVATSATNVDDYLFCDGTSVVSLDVDEVSGKATRATLVNSTLDTSTMVFEFNDEGMPSLISVDGNYIILDNHNGSSVDISCINSDGDIFASTNVATSVAWDQEAIALGTRAGFVDSMYEGLTNDFKTIGIGVAYGLMSITDLCTVMAKGDFSVSGLKDKFEASKSIGENFGKAIITAFAQDDPKMLMLATLDDEDMDEKLLSAFEDAYGVASDPSWSNVKDLLLDNLSNRTGNWLLDLVTDADKIEKVKGYIGKNYSSYALDDNEGDDEDDGTVLANGYIKLRFDMSPIKFDKISFREPDYGYVKDDNGNYVCWGDIDYSHENGLSDDSRTLHNVLIGSGDTWVEIYYENAPNGTYGCGWWSDKFNVYVDDNYLDRDEFEAKMTVTTPYETKTYSFMSTAWVSWTVDGFDYNDGVITNFPQ